ncbi:MAG TPA: PIG-L deacetylase family protein [Acidimicrobiales bacterium]|jgi:LmbE family N-acetylglucosaminyl deacetylase|nr:PIG-L deacetylase family protein [Acidimicrobiales bacterium]
MEADLLTEAPASAMAVYAHPDDPDISCGGTLALWAAAGTEIHVVICASGDKGSSDPAAVAAAVVERRAAEAQEAALILGVAGVHMLGRPDGEFENDRSLRADLVGLIRRRRPEILVCPDPTAVFFGSHHYNHRDHRIVGWAALDSASPAAASSLYFPEQGAAHEISTVLLSGSLEPNVWVDIGSSIDKKLQAVSCHESQLADANDWYASALRDGAQHAGQPAGISYAEAFRRIRLL